MAKRRPCGCSTCLILRELKRLEQLVMEALLEKYPLKGPDDEAR